MSAQPEIVTLPIGEVKPYWRNPRNNREAVEKVKESIQKFGYNQLIGVDKDHTIIVGHTRYLALVALGYTEVKVMVLDMDEQKVKAYRIADNKAAEYATWDKDLLASELKEMGDIDDLEVFFKDDELDILSGNMDLQVASSAAADVTPEKMAKADKELKDKYGARQAVIDTICPRCGHEFQVGK